MLEKLTYFGPIAVSPLAGAAMAKADVPLTTPKRTKLNAADRRLVMLYAYVIAYGKRFLTFETLSEPTGSMKAMGGQGLVRPTEPTHHG